MFKKQSTSWAVEGKRVAANTPGAIRVVMESKKWYGNLNGKHIALNADKTTAAKMLRKLQTDADLDRLGLGDPFAADRNKPLDEHLQDYKAILLGKGSNEEYAQRTLSQISAIVIGCGFKNIADFDHGKVSTWLSQQRQPRPLVEPPQAVEGFTPSQAAGIFDMSRSGLNAMIKRHGLLAIGKGKARRLPRKTLEAIAEIRAKGISPETANHYNRSIRAFTRWLVQANRLPHNPMVGLKLVNSQVEIRHGRRELSAEEIRRLLQVTRESTRRFRGLSGTDRAILYLTAVLTGFRARALANLTPTDFNLLGPTPVVNLAARFNKSKKTKIQPLPPEAVVALTHYLAQKSPHLPVWGSSWLGKGADMIRSDLEAAGISYVVVGLNGPEFADFHALRHSYLTLLGRNGTDMRTAQVLAGHSTPLLTARYMHRNLNDLAEAVARLPMLTSV